MTIIQTLTPPGTAPARSQPAATFITNADAHVAWQATHVNEMTTWTAQVNAIVSGTAGDIASGINGATAKTTPVDADLLTLTDSTASFVLKKFTWANLKATLASTFAPLAGSASQAFSVATATAAAHAVRADGVMGRNRIINGGFNVWQRAITYALTSTQTYGSLDRWSFVQDTSAAGIANQDGSSAIGFRYALKIGRNNGSALTNPIRMYYAAETIDSILLRGQIVTLSFYAKAGANFSAASSNLSIRLAEGTGIDQASNLLSGGSWTGYSEKVSTNQALTTSWVRYSFIGTFGATMSQFGVGFFYTPTGTAGADDNFYITGVQLELGSVATQFEARHYGTELALCQRYYFDTGSSAYFPGLFGGYNTTGNNGSASGHFPVTMRTTPTGTVLGTFGTVNCGQPLLTSSVNTTGYFAYATVTSTGPISWYSNGSGHFTFSAEL